LNRTKEKRVKIEILIRSMKAIKPSDLKRKSSIGHRKLKLFIEDLKAEGLLEEIKSSVRDKRSKIKYKTTSEGRLFLENILESDQVIKNYYWRVLTESIF